MAEIPLNRRKYSIQPTSLRGYMYGAIIRFSFCRNLTTSNSTNISQLLERYHAQSTCANTPFIPKDRWLLAFSAISLTIFGLGFTGNILTIAIILCSKKLHTPTFTMITCLAVSDAFSLFVFVLLHYTNTYILVDLCAGMNEKLVAVLFEILDLQARLNAGSQLCLLASLRYVAIVNPLKFKIFFTSRRVVIISSLGWICVLIVSTAAVFGGVRTSVKLQFCHTILFFNLANFIIPTLVFITLHCLKLRALRRSPSLNNKSFARMNVVITLVIVIYILSSSAICVDRAIGCYSYFSTDLADIAFLLNCAINPLIYFFASPPILNKFCNILQTLRCLCTGNTNIDNNINMKAMSS